ncbi:MAG TPA: GIY-YIG nuclease family protein [Terriglobales bacterium]|jgi:putative endonuclease|nr:GIY-YIG nuclease family protein [Terriglobales bacterium]
MHDYKYFVYMLNSSSRRALYTDITNALTTRVLEHRRAENPKSFTAQYSAFRLAYYEEFADVRAAIAHENQIKGSTRAKKNALVASMNPQWRDLVLEWEKKYGLVFQLDGRIVKAEAERQHQHQPQGPSPKSRAQDDTS